MNEVLRTLGVIKITNLGSATEALASMDLVACTFILTDWQLDGINGVAFTRAVRRLDWPQCALPVIMLTAHTTRAAVEEARQAGVDEFISKPVTAAALLSRLREVSMRPRDFVDTGKYVGPCRRRRPLPPDYGGPLRRLSDPFEMPRMSQEDVEIRQEFIKQGVEKISEIARSLNPGDRLQVRAIYNNSQETHQVAVELQDNLLERATRSLIRYIEATGGNGDLKTEVVNTHVHAILELARMPHHVSDERQRMARGLEAMVAKKLREGDAAGDPERRAAPAAASG